VADCVPCYVADDPLSCVGTGLALEHAGIPRDSLEEP
jgi:rod shape-determining protein MreB and related proteins